MKSSVFAALVIAGSSCYAADDADPFSFLREEAVIVSASKHPQRMADVPASAIVVTAEDIQSHGYLTLAEVLGSVPGIYVADDRNYSYVWFRGFGRPGDYNGRILVLVNGHRINENIYGGAYLGNDFTVPMEAVDRVEIVKGPSSSLYGDSAFFGVVNVVTKTPDRAPRIHVSAQTGSYGTHKEFVGVSADHLPMKSDLYVAGSYHHSDGVSHLRYPEFSSVNQGIAVRSDGEKDYNLLAVWRSGPWMFQGNSNSRTKQIPTGSYDVRFNDSRNQTTDARYFAEAKWEKEILSDLTATVRAYYDWYGFRQEFYFDDATAASGVEHNQDDSVARWAGEEVRVRWTRWGQANALTLGQEVEKNFDLRQKNRDVDPTVYFLNTNTTPHRWATYLQQEWKPISRLALTAGGRVDYYETFGYTANPRFAAVISLWDQAVGKLIYGSAFRAPTPFERQYETAGRSKQNLSLNPEQIRTGEVVLEQTLPGGSWFSLGAYASRVSHLISQTTDPTDGLIYYTNSETIHSNGLEVSSRWVLTPRLKTRLGYILQTTREADGDSGLSNSPTHVGYGSLDGRLPVWETLIGIDTFVIGSRRSTQNTHLPPAATASLSLRQPLGASGCSVFARVNNLLDTKLVVSGAEEHVQDAIAQDGRHFHVGLEWRWH